MDYSNKIRRKRWPRILLIIVLAVILFFLAMSTFYFIGEIKNAKLKSSRAGQIRQLAESDQIYNAAAGDHYWLGSEDAKITVVEFGDFACPVCLSAFPTVREISLKYKNDIKFIWRDFPVVVENYSAALALAGRCAGEQGLFWSMHDRLFQNQSANQLNQAALTNLANQIGADTDKFNNCLIQEKYLPQIQKDLLDGQAFGISGTPTYFINGYKIVGDIPYDTFVKIIEELKK